jgi:hypothetical protein
VFTDTKSVKVGQPSALRNSRSSLELRTQGVQVGCCRPSLWVIFCVFNQVTDDVRLRINFPRTDNRPRWNGVGRGEASSYPVDPTVRIPLRFLDFPRKRFGSLSLLPS